MPNSRHKYIFEQILIGFTAIFLVGGLLALGFLPNLSRENRALIIISTSIVALSSVFGLLVIGRVKKWLRLRLWRRAMAAWKKSSCEDETPEFDLALHLSDGGLMHLAVQIYSRMGYDVFEPEEDGDQHLWVRMVNPEGKIELVYCKQCPELLGVRQVTLMQKAMRRENAIKGFIWAPSGFSDQAIQWVKNRPIILADNHGIGRFVESVRKTRLIP